MTDATETRVAIWGTFDVANFGDHLFPRIFEQEMRRRLPTARVQAFSPLGHLHPVPFDGGLMVEPLGEWSSRRLAELARDYDLVAIGGGEIIHSKDDLYASYYGTSLEEARGLQPSRFFVEGLGPDLEESCPVAWHSVGIPCDPEEGFAARIRSALEKRAYVTVRDHISRDRLLRAGVTGEIEVIPDSAFLVDRIFDTEKLERRLAYLRGIASYPSSGRPLVVQGSRALLPHVESIGRSLASALADADDVPVVILETGPCHGDTLFAETIAPYLDGNVYRMPASPLVEDIVAALAHSRGFVGASLHGSEIAFARGLPSAILDLGTDYSKLAAFAALVHGENTLVRTAGGLLPSIRRVISGKPPWDGLREITDRIDSHFDKLAELAESSALKRPDRSPPQRRPGTDRTGALVEAPEEQTVSTRAFEARGRRLVEQRLRLGAEIERSEQELERSEQERSQLAEEIKLLTEERPRYEREIRLHKAEIDRSHGEIDRSHGEIDRSHGEIDRSHGEIDRLNRVLGELLNSKSIRYTAPFRGIIGRLRRFVR